MVSPNLPRWTGVALVLGGVCLAMFVVVLYPVGGFFGADHARHPAWVPAHSLHFVGAILSLFGLVGLYASQGQRLGRLGAFGFVLSTTGMAQFVGTGMLTAFVWPVLAASAPDTLAPQGALFVAPANLLFYTTVLALVPGFVLLAIALLRSSSLPRPASVLLAVGVVLAITPPEPVGPVPWLGLVVGGLLFAAGEVWLGISLWSANPPPMVKPA